MAKIAYIDNYPEDRIEHFEFFKYLFENYPRYTRRVLSHFYETDIVSVPVDFYVSFFEFELLNADFFLVFNIDTNIKLPENIPILLIVSNVDSSYISSNVRIIKENEFFEYIKKNLICIDFPFLYDFILKRVQEYCDKAIALLSTPTTNLLTFKPQNNGSK